MTKINIDFKPLRLGTIQRALDKCHLLLVQPHFPEDYQTFLKACQGRWHVGVFREQKFKNLSRSFLLSFITFLLFNSTLTFCSTYTVSFLILKTHWAYPPEQHSPAENRVICFKK